MAKAADQGTIDRESAGERRRNAIAGLILAGGRARRLGGDKPFRRLGGESLLARAIGRALPQVGSLAISANEPPARFAQFRLPVIPDTVPDFAGPVAGILAGMEWAASHGIEDLVSFSCDAPFFPSDLVAKLAAARVEADAVIACAASGGRIHPVFGLFPVRLRDELRDFLAGRGLRKVEAWIARYPCARAEFPVGAADPFFNINTPADFAAAESLLRAGGSADNAAIDTAEKP